MEKIRNRIVSYSLFSRALFRPFLSDSSYWSDSCSDILAGREMQSGRGAMTKGLILSPWKIHGKTPARFNWSRIRSLEASHRNGNRRQATDEKKSHSLTRYVPFYYPPIFTITLFAAKNFYIEKWASL